MGNGWGGRAGFLKLSAYRRVVRVATEVESVIYLQPNQLN